MNKKETLIYPLIWHKVEYEINETFIDFKVFEIEELNEDSPALSVFSDNPVMKGFIKWDGCCEFDYSTHYCGLHNAENFLQLMKSIYNYAMEKFK